MSLVGGGGSLSGSHGKRESNQAQTNMKKIMIIILFVSKIEKALFTFFITFSIEVIYFYHPYLTYIDTERKT